jgi:hypothetical protein
MYMEGPRACRKEERSTVISLIDKTFRTANGYKPTMGEEFQLMLGEGNLDNMRIILEDGVPAANVNFYKSTILVEGVPVKAASIGAVCTDINSRGKGYSSIILDDCERLMKKDDTRLMLVSGTRSLYTRRGCAEVGKCYQFIIEPSKDSHDNLQLQEYDDSLLEIMTKLYNKESTRYYRTFEEFKYLLKGATTPWANYTYKVYAVKDSESYCSYIVLRVVNDKEGNWGAVVEAAGDRKTVTKALEEVIRLNSLKYIKYFCTFNDESARILKREEKSFTEWSLLGSIRILDFKGLMKDLIPYFQQYIDKDTAENIRFHEEDHKYIISLKSETLGIDNIQDLTKLIFGSKDHTCTEFKDKPLISEFIRNVFPMPFVWTANLNYQ